jgi:hypothetical protein
VAPVPPETAPAKPDKAMGGIKVSIDNLKKREADEKAAKEVKKKRKG